MNRILPLALVIALLATAIPMAAVHAYDPAPAVDQSYTAPGIAAVAFSGCCQYVAQTFTAGVTGALTGVSIDVASADLYGELHVQLVGVTDGVPNGKLLGERFLWTPDLHPIANAPLSYLVELWPIYVTAGTQYAIVVNYTGTAPDGGPHGTWSGGEADPYPRGRVFLGSEYTLTQWTPAQADLDLHFRTIVDPNMPIADLSIVRLSGPKKAHACQVFKETYRVTNNGPDTASYIQISAGGGDQFDAVSVDGVAGPYSDFFELAPGQSRTIVVYLKVVAFGPGEERNAFIGASIFWDYVGITGLDPNMDNNVAGTPIYLVGKPSTKSCPVGL